MAIQYGCTINRYNLDKLKERIDKAHDNSSEAHRRVYIEGEWLLKASEGPQFTGAVRTERGMVVVGCDEPTFLGGGGTVPGPMQFFFYGALGCFISTYAQQAALRGIVLRSLKVKATVEMDLSRFLGISPDPIVKRIDWKISVDSDATDQQLEELKMQAEEASPAYYCLTNPAKLEISVARE